MPAEEKPSITLLLGRIQEGDEIARQEVFDLAYAELRGLAKGLMRNERPEHTLQPTALVNEAAARMLHGESLEGMKCREYFFAAMARAMRQVLVSHARMRNRLKRGGEYQRVPLDDTIDHVEQEHQFDLIALERCPECLAAAQRKTLRSGYVAVFRWTVDRRHRRASRDFRLYGSPRPALRASLVGVAFERVGVNSWTRTDS